MLPITPEIILKVKEKKNIKKRLFSFSFILSIFFFDSLVKTTKLFGYNSANEETTNPITTARRTKMIEIVSQILLKEMTS